MRKVILQQFVTIDNFAAGPNGAIDFIMSMGDKPREDFIQDSLNFVDSIDTILLGAVTYQMFAGYWPDATIEVDPIADKLNATPKIVFSKTLETAPWGKWEDATIVSSNATEEVRKLKQRPGKDIVVWGSISLSHSLIKEGLIDEYQLRQLPVVIGKGKSAFPAEIETLNMNLVEAKAYESGMALLRYQPAALPQK